MTGRKQRDTHPLLDRYDGDAHGRVRRRRFPGRAAAFSPAGLSAATLLDALSPDHALATRITPDDKWVNAFRPTCRDASEKHGRTLSEYTYADARRGFHNDTTPRYDAGAAALAWQRSIEFFDRVLV